MRSLITSLVLVCLTIDGCQQVGGPSAKPEVTYAIADRDVKISSWQPELTSDVVLVIDQSGSMSRGRGATDPAGLRVKGSAAFLEFLAGRSRFDLANRFGVVNFGTEAPRKYAVPLTPITSVEDPVIKRIESQLVPLDLGETNFIDALRRAVELLREGGVEGRWNRAIVVFTDGEPDDPRKLTPQVYFAELKVFLERELRPYHVDLFIVGIDAVGRRWTATVPYWKHLLGPDHVFMTPTMEALKAQFNRIVQRIWHLPEVEPVVVSSLGPTQFEVEPYLAAVEFHIFPGRQGLALRIHRPSGKIVKPGLDADTPPVKHLSTFDRIVVNEPEPGMWIYEVVGGKGSVEVLRNPIPLRLGLISPAPVHPQGKPMRLIAEFKRADGRPIKDYPDYPLGLTAEVKTPSGHRIPVKLEPSKGGAGQFVGTPDIEGTMATGPTFRSSSGASRRITSGRKGQA